MAKLPKDVTYVCKQKEDTHIQTISNRVFKNVVEAFPVDSSNKKGFETAIRWAHGYNHKTHLEEAFPNDPMYDVTIIDMESRSQNGKVYKALVKGRYYVDLRIDVVLDLMINGEISGGVIKSPMLWVRGKGGMRLTRKGSEEYNECFDDETSVYVTEQFQPGYVYFNNKTKRVVSVFPDKVRLFNTQQDDSKNGWSPYHCVVTTNYATVDIDMNSIAPYSNNDLLCNANNIGNYYSIINEKNMVTYSSKVPIDSSTINKFLVEIIENIRTMVISDNELDTKRHMGNHISNAYSFMLLANERGINMANCPNFVKISTYVNSYRMVIK